MANRTAWTAGNGVGFTWTTAINGSDMVSLATGSTVLSSVADIANDTALDLFAMVSVEITVGSFTPPGGAYIGIYIAQLNQDGTTYGDGTLTSGSTITRSPPYQPVGIIPLESAAAITLMSGVLPKIELPPGKFRFAVFNNSNASFSGTAGNNVIKYQTYNINLNA